MHPLLRTLITVDAQAMLRRVVFASVVLACGSSIFADRAMSQVSAAARENVPSHLAPAGTSAQSGDSATAVLYRTVAALDSALFAAYNKCDLARLGAMVTDDLEFYHDQTGLAVGRQALVEGVRQNVCGRVRRDLVPGTLEVHPLKGYGAVETGEHLFCDARIYGTCPDSASGIARFVMLWRQPGARRASREDSQLPPATSGAESPWQLTRVISYAHVSSFARPRATPTDSANAGVRSSGISTTRRSPLEVLALRDSLDAHAPEWLARWKVGSLAIAYVTERGVEWTRVYGEQSPGVPATERTLYNVASLTKPLFAELVLHLAAAGRVALDQPIFAAAPTWVDPDIRLDPRHRALTLRLLLSQRSGFPNWRRETGGVLRFVAEPGTKYGYSGEGYDYAARYLERRLGASLETLARSSVYRTLGLRDVAFTEQDWFRGRVAWPKVADGRFIPPPFSQQGSGADLLYATVGDYAAFLSAVLRRTDLADRFARQRDSIHVEDPSAQAACQPSVAIRCPDSTGYGLGWAIMRYTPALGSRRAAQESPHAETVLWHTGSDEGTRALAAYIPERHVGVVMFATGSNGFQPMIDAGSLLLSGSPFVGYLRSGRP